MPLTPPIPQEQLEILQSAATLAAVADSAYQYNEEAAIALRLNSAANDGVRGYTTNKTLTADTLTKLKSLGYIVQKIGGNTEIHLPKEANP
jgi:hypothetical protein